jgi:N-acetylmuramate 1-kinase
VSDPAAALDRPALPPDLAARVDRFLTETGADRRVRALIPLTPDASDRRYVRVEFFDRAAYVLAVHAGPIAFEQLTFANVRALLAEMPVPVPAILGHSDALGIVALQDLGDVTLHAHLATVSAATRAFLYEEAVRLVEVVQRRGAELASPRHAPYGLAFDVAKLTWELAFFATHFLGAHRAVALTPAERDALGHEFLTLATELANEPRVLCHRDYHSRNLMVHDGTLHLIDFQDARMGPDTYDLASLLRDSYVDVAEPEVERLLAYFGTLRAHHAPGAPIAGYTDDFRRRFDLMSLQRNLKALGTFGFQATSRGNPAYLRDVPRTLRHVTANLERYSRFARLRTVLATHLPELR